jgi:hypothetical protein
MPLLSCLIFVCFHSKNVAFTVEFMKEDQYEETKLAAMESEKAED